MATKRRGFGDKGQWWTFPPGVIPPDDWSETTAGQDGSDSASQTDPSDSGDESPFDEATVHEREPGEEG